MPDSISAARYWRSMSMSGNGDIERLWLSPIKFGGRGVAAEAIYNRRGRLLEMTVVFGQKASELAEGDESEVHGCVRIVVDKNGVAHVSSAMWDDYKFSEMEDGGKVTVAPRVKKPSGLVM